MNNHIPEAGKMVCPDCGAAMATKENGSPCRNHDGSWVAFECLTAIHAGRNDRALQSFPCKEAERARLLSEITTLRTTNADLADKVKVLEAVTSDPHAFWTSWLRGAVNLPAGIGDIRQSEEKAIRYRERWLSWRKTALQQEERAERAEELVKRLKEAGDRMRMLCADGDDCDSWDKAKATP